MSELNNQNTDTPLPEPTKPRSDDCCGGGSCCPCVWDEYRVARKAWIISVQKSEILEKSN
ncbi:oxidoreductase-like domain-containing protein [Pseudoalteromonas sp. MMG005]|uniref:oxidoreductase-like domain-containing protein n=1 Tax=Pseudoalteromonas sp. MMG005 TaxID=2822682 RepID=UPI001B3A062A|nr:oxidoreductase-like domain-containing protein [Pseudoalteromonas sp. MMG005]MBQ4847239.1 hypothetical protein [Pseudoalteromonas sp. MMG005]